MAGALKRTGIVVLITGLLFGYVVRAVTGDSDSTAALLISFLPAVMVIGGAFLFWRGRQYAARAAAATALSDANPDVLYLRDFSTDPSTAGQVFSSILTPKLISGLATEEEQLAEAVKPLGDLVAIGKPGEELPTPGAARLYASDEEWRDIVSNQMRNARLVVIRAGSGEGLVWELKRAVELVAPQKLLLLVLQMKREHYRYFRHMASEILGVPLPEAERSTRFGRISGFIAFGSDRTATFLRLHAPFWRRSGYKPLLRLFQYALRPVFEASGVPWKQPPVSGLTVFSVVVAGLFALLLLTALGVTLFSPSPDRELEPVLAAAVPVETEDPYTVAANRFTARVAASDELREVLTADGANARQIAHDLTSQGLRRLSDDLLIRRAALMARISAEADIATCAAMFRGETSPGLEAAVARLEPKEIEQWFAVLYDSMSAQVRQTPTPPLAPPAQVQRSLQELLGTMSPPDAELLSAMLQSPRTGSPEDACRAGRLMYGGVGNLPEDSKATLARALVWP